jgi:Spy/CpxP family protein refolding chaperone
MKIKLITLTTLSALSLGSSAFAQEPTTAAQDQQGGRGGPRHNSLQRTTEQLNLTPEQKAKVQPIVDQATPQIENIRREAMQKTKAVMDNAMAQIRPLLTPEQQKKLDDAQNDRRGGHGGRGGRGGRHGQRDQDDSDNS